MLLADRVAIVTGGASGMGRAIAVKFAEEGCDVAVADVNLPQALQTLEMVRQRGRDGLALECDVSNTQQVKNAVNAVLAKWGKIDILVNAAGKSVGGARRGAPASITSISDEDWNRTIAINLTGPFLFCREVVPHMKARRYGKIINISTLGWIHPPAVSPHYHGAKAGVVGLTNDLAAELGPYNINVNAILPGPVRTAFYDEMLKGRTPDEIDAFFEAVGKTTPLQRVGVAEDIAGVALFLASELSSYITGASIPVGGGLPIKPYTGKFGGSA
ncbi:MAG: SDR family NAD(P)-dependent oxidoreductase [Moorellales bacterium]